MVVVEANYGAGLAKKTLDRLSSYCIATQPVPWDKWSQCLDKHPKKIIYCTIMEESHLESLAKEKPDVDFVVGLGGGVSCDTGKYLAWKWQKPLITIPSIISVDAFLSKEVGIRNQNRVRYIGSAIAKELIIDFDLIRSAPAFLNYSGIGDIISCATALGDWRIANKEFGDPINETIFNATRELVIKMIQNVASLHALSNEGIKNLVEYLREECILSEQWGNARPEEGGEHFLAYALEKVSPHQYLHGSLIALNVLVVLRLQGKDAVFSVNEIREFYEKLGVNYSPAKLKIDRLDYQNALEYVQKHVADEKLFHGLWNRKNPFENASIKAILDWIYSF